MISICIPIFNHDIRRTVHHLHDQIVALGEEMEIICIDDGSREEIRVMNRGMDDICKYIELENNVGRSRIRNMFLQYVSEKCEYMIFMDCDLEVRDEYYLKRYVGMAQAGVMVVVGGHRYVEQDVGTDYILHYTYGNQCEIKTIAERRKNPNRSFMTGNFMIAKKLLEMVKFDERIRGYGHEDTLMGYRLQQRGVEVKHIDNPLWVRDLDTNENFLDKTEESVWNLWRIVKWVNEPEFEKQVSLIACYNKVKRFKIRWIIKGFFKATHVGMRKRFEQGWNNMIALKIYKLGLLIEIANRSC